MNGTNIWIVICYDCIQIQFRFAHVPFKPHAVHSWAITAEQQKKLVTKMFSSVEVIFEVLTIKGGWEGGPESGLTINSFALE